MNAFSKIWNIVTTILVTLLVIVAIALVGVRIFGLTPYTVLSGSMEPEYPTGSLIYDKSVDTKDLKVGDVITFMLSEDTLATHRITQIVPDETNSSVLRFQTKGDANDTVDGTLVHQNNVVGTPVFCIPYLGWLANFIQNPPGMYLAIAIAAVVLMLVFLPELFKKDPDAPTKEQKQAIKAQKRARKDQGVQGAHAPQYAYRTPNQSSYTAQTTYGQTPRGAYAAQGGRSCAPYTVYGANNAAFGNGYAPQNAGNSTTAGAVRTNSASDMSSAVGMRPSSYAQSGAYSNLGISQTPQAHRGQSAAYRQPAQTRPAYTEAGQVGAGHTAQNFQPLGVSGAQNTYNNNARGSLSANAGWQVR